jgi:chromosome segregation ATPase
MEIEHRLDAERASEDIRTLQEQLDETELRLAETEARARTAEARAAEAEAWLAKMHDAIVGSFARVVAGDDNAEAELRAAFANGDLGNPA